MAEIPGLQTNQLLHRSDNGPLTETYQSGSLGGNTSRWPSPALDQRVFHVIVGQDSYLAGVLSAGERLGALAALLLQCPKSSGI